MFSLQTRLKIYIIFSILTFIAGAMSFLLIEMRLQPVFDEIGTAYPDTVSFMDHVYTFVLVLTIFAILFGGFIFTFTFIRGINKYKDFTRRLSSIEYQENYSLKSIKFPKEDEFGNIGSQLNMIVEKLNRFDNLKVERIKIEKQKFETLCDILEFPVLVIDVRKEEKKIKYYNKSFQNTFIRNTEENLFYDIRNSLISALKIQTASKEKENVSEKKQMEYFIDDEFVHAIDLAATSRTETKIKKDIRTLAGKEIYHSDNISIKPFLNDVGETLDVMILFEKLKKK